MYAPIPLDAIYDKIIRMETELRGDLWNFWQMIKIAPEKWEETSYGKNIGGFWVVALCGKRAIWYNDFEYGFNISAYRSYGKIGEYFCNQDELVESITRLFDLIKFGGEIIGQAGAPQAGEFKGRIKSCSCNVREA
ncbi:MAG: hypothetical protein LBS89_01055 [Zoogloeaceae bacterium]|jgi:hypothetical protein|nr:hypothetical protein [Zoogloeaceae bacterium]